MSTSIPAYQPFTGNAAVKINDDILSQSIPSTYPIKFDNSQTSTVQTYEITIPSKTPTITVSSPPTQLYTIQNENPTKITTYSNNGITSTVQKNAYEEVVKRSKQNGSADQTQDNKQEIEELKQKLEARDQHILQLIKTIDLKDSQIQQLREDLSKAITSQQSSVIITSNTVNQQELTTLRNQNQNLELDNRKLANLVEERSAQFEQERQDILKQLSIARTEAANMKQSVQFTSTSSSAELNAAREKSLLLEKINLDLNSQIRTLSLQVDSFKQQTIELDRLRVASNSQANSTEFVQKLESENQSLRNQLYSASQINISSNQTAIQRLEEKLKESQATLERERLANESSKANFQRIIAELQQNQQSLSNSQQYQEELYNLTQQLKIKNQDAVDLAGLGDNLRSQLVQKDELIQSLNYKIQQSEQYRVEIENLRTQLSSIRGQYETELQSLREKNTNAMVVLVETQAALESASQSLLSFNQQYKLLEDDNRVLAQKCHEYQNALVDKENIEREIHGLTHTLEAMSNSSKEKDRRVELLIRQIEEYEYKLKQLAEKDAKNQQLNILISEKDSRIQQFLLQQNELNVQIQSLHTQLEQKDKAIQLLTKQLNERESIELLQKQLREAQTVIQNQQSQLRDVDNLRRQIDGLRVTVSEKEAEIGNLSRQLRELEAVRRQIEAFRETISQKDVEISNLTRQLRDLDGIRRQADSDRALIQEKEQRIQMLLRQVSDSEYTIRNLQAENADLKTALSNQTNRNSNNPELLQTIVLLQSSLEAQTARTKQLELLPRVDEAAASREYALQSQLNQIKSQYDYAQSSTIQLNRENDYLKEQLQKKDGEMIYLQQQSYMREDDVKRAGRNTNQNDQVKIELLQQLEEQDRTIKDLKLRLESYIDKNSELATRMEILQTSSLTPQRQSERNDVNYYVLSQSKEELLNKYKKENILLQKQLEELQRHLQFNQDQYKQANQQRGWGCR